MRLLPFEYAVRNVGRSRFRLAASVTGAALVAGLVLTAAAFVRGMQHSLTLEGAEDNVVLLSAGSEDSIERSQLEAQVPGVVAAAVPGIRQRLGVPYLSPEVHVALTVRLEPDDPRVMLATFRGVLPAAFLVHPQVRIVEGRAPVAGRDELLVGSLAAARMGLDNRHLAVGGTLWLDNRRWTIVGRFAAPGTIMEAEIWCPLTDLQIVTRRDSISCIVLTLGDAELADVQTFCKQRLDLELVAMRESEYYRKLLDFYGPIRVMVLVTAGLVALGGLLGGLNSMYAALAGRVRELATLQTLGFSPAAILLSLIQESVLACAAGALVALLLGAVGLDGVAVRFSMGAFGLRVDAAAVATAMAAGLALGGIGALLPGWRCLRLPVMDALRTA